MARNTVKRPVLVTRRRTYAQAKAVRDLMPIVMQRDRRCCVYCQRPAGVVDHVVPLSRGGTDTLDNLVAACSDCNSRKGWRLLEELGWEIRPVKGLAS